MKSRIVNQQKETPTIDWSKKQIVKSTDDLIVLTTGKHKDGLFSGVIMSTSDDVYSGIGTYAEDWIKESFIPVTTPVTIEFIPE